MAMVDTLCRASGARVVVCVGTQHLRAGLNCVAPPALVGARADGKQNGVRRCVVEDRRGCGM